VTLANWKSQHNLTGASTLDTDGDQLPDLVEFLLGTNPRQPSDQGAFIRPERRRLTVGGIENDYFCVEISANPLAEGVEYRVESTANLGAWRAGMNYFVVHSSSTTNGRTTALWRSAISSAGTPRLFVRIAAREVTP
jgi:hypothetical protein